MDEIEMVSNKTMICGELHFAKGKVLLWYPICQSSVFREGM